MDLKEEPILITLVIETLHGERMNRIVHRNMTFKDIMKDHRPVIGPWVGGMSFYRNGRRVDPLSTPSSLWGEDVDVVYLQAY